MRLSTVLLAVVLLMLAGSALGGVSSEEALQELIENLPPGAYWDEDHGCLVHDPPIALELPKSALLTQAGDTIYFDNDTIFYSESWYDPPDHFALTRMPTPECPPQHYWILKGALLGCFNTNPINGPPEGTVAVYKHDFKESCKEEGPNIEGDFLGEMLASKGFVGEPVNFDSVPKATWTQVDFDIPVPILDTVFWLAWDYDVTSAEGGAWYSTGKLLPSTKPEDANRFFWHYEPPCPTFWVHDRGPWLMRAVGTCVGVYIDIKPLSCPNPLNIGSHGVLPVAILGTERLDVTQIDPETITMLGLVPKIRSNPEDITEPFTDPLCGCWTNPADGYDDLTVKFDKQAVVSRIMELWEEVEDGDEIELTLEFKLKDEFGGTSFEGVDCVVIVEGKGGGTRHVGSSTPVVFALFQNNPNPFVRETSISYNLPASGHTTLKIYDMSGRLVTTLVDAEMNAGIYSITWDRKNTASGIYFYRLVNNGNCVSREMTVLR